MTGFTQNPHSANRIHIRRIVHKTPALLLFVKKNHETAAMKLCRV